MEKCDKYATTQEYEEIIQSKRYHMGSTSKGLKKKEKFIAWVKEFGVK